MRLARDPRIEWWGSVRLTLGWFRIPFVLTVLAWVAGAVRRMPPGSCSWPSPSSPLPSSSAGTSSTSPWCPLDMPGSFARTSTGQPVKAFDALLARAGIGHGEERYRYETDDRFGTMSASAGGPTRWVRTTCGYCSVGCGMLLGVRDGKAVAVQGDPDHPVNRGPAVPEGPDGAPHDRRAGPAHRAPRRRPAGVVGRGPRARRRHVHPAAATSTAPRAWPCCRPASS